MDILKKKVAQLQDQVTSLSTGGGKVSNINANPSFTCGCSNDTSFSFTFRGQYWVRAMEELNLIIYVSNVKPAQFLLSGV